MSKFIEIVNFWMKHRKNWFKPSNEFDTLCSNKYKDYFDYYDKIKYNQNSSKEVLGKIILLDQLSRNIYRNTKKSYYFDKEACHEMLKNFYLSTELEGWYKIFFLMPLKHSENIVNQKQNIKLWKTIIDNTFDMNLVKLYEKNLKTCKEHLMIIKIYGRFPKRNKFLERKNTKSEKEYLKDKTFNFI